MKDWKRSLTRASGGRLVLLPYRAMLALRCWKPPVRIIWQWLLASREITNFTYDQTDRGKDMLAHVVACATESDFSIIRGYAAELDSDDLLRQHVSAATEHSDYRNISDAGAKAGRRLLYYLLVRACKPRVTVEIGVDHGLGTCIMSAALSRNSEEGFPGFIFGVDIRADAGWLFTPPYKAFGSLSIRDACAFLREFAQPIDLLLNDSMNNREYEWNVLRSAEHVLRPHSILVSSWHNGSLMRYAQQSERRYLVARDEPRNHWYRGSEMALAFAPGKKVAA